MQKYLPEKMLRELLKNSKNSDRELAKILGVSQPTVTRTRHTLEKEGTIQEYTVVPDFERMGFEILAMTFMKGRSGTYSQGELEAEHEKVKEHFGKLPNVIFVSSGEGLGMVGIVISFHRNYTDYRAFLNTLRLNWGKYIGDMKHFVVSVKEEKFKRFSLTYLGDLPL